MERKFIVATALMTLSSMAVGSDGSTVIAKERYSAAYHRAYEEGQSCVAVSHTGNALEQAVIAITSYDDGRRKLLLLLKRSQTGIIANFDLDKSVRFTTYTHDDNIEFELKPTGLRSWAADTDFYPEIKTNINSPIKLTLSQGMLTKDSFFYFDDAVIQSYTACTNQIST
ncbi:hypothetical protein [Vibrio rarus]|uniref:hypothetical protein n=1 Tax=Vibrio rarus TaxID=413403 RepID=UPI0021C481F0|nr:hypothetical protein [Vibrio rarus]